MLFAATAHLLHVGVPQRQPESALVAPKLRSSAYQGSTKLASCQYVPSPVELEWTSAKAVGKICAIADRDSQVNAAHEWLTYVQTSKQGTQQRPPPPSLSRWECADGSVEYIEPLVGVARHPFARCNCPHARKDVQRVNLYNITYLMLAQGSCDAPVTRRSNLFYDLGCSVYGTSTKQDSDRGSAYGPSLPLFDDMYRQQCLKLDHMYGWELRQMNLTEWWQFVPDDVAPRLTFYNLPGVAQEIPHSNSSFFGRLKETAKPDDFVSVKVDIDHVPTELPLVTSIATRPDISSLVDEVFFEYHFWFDNLNFGWQSQKGGQHYTTRTVDDALALMQRLRRVGVRSHWWI